MATVKAQKITFPGQETKDLMKSLSEMSQKVSDKYPGAKKWMDKALNVLRKKEQVSPKESFGPEGFGTPGIVEREDQTLRIQSIISNVNKYKTFIKSSGELVNSIRADQEVLVREYKRVRDLVKELGPYVNRQSGQVGINPESDRIINSLEDAYGNIKTLMGRIQDSVDDKYDSISDVQIEGGPQIMTPEMAIEE